MKSLPFVVSVLISLFLNKVSAINTLSLEKFGRDNIDGECQIRNEKYWTTIREFYGSVNLVSIYFIHPFKPNASTFTLSNTLLQQIPKSMYLKGRSVDLNNLFIKITVILTIRSPKRKSLKILVCMRTCLPLLLTKSIHFFYKIYLAIGLLLSCKWFQIKKFFGTTQGIMILGN